MCHVDVVGIDVGGGLGKSAGTSVCPVGLAGIDVVRGAGKRFGAPIRPADVGRGVGKSVGSCPVDVGAENGRGVGKSVETYSVDIVGTDDGPTSEGAPVRTLDRLCALSMRTCKTNRGKCTNASPTWSSHVHRPQR